MNDNHDNAKAPAVTGRTVLRKGRAVELHELSWTGADGVEHAWESAERVNAHGAVLIVPRLIPSRRLVLIRQFRPPAGMEVLEFPAGLIDAGEAPEVTAVRELAEETGYHGAVVRMTPPTYNSPGLTSETVHEVLIDIDETRPENESPEAAPEGTENIRVVLVPMDELPGMLEKEYEAGRAVDSKVAAFALGSA